MAVVGLLHQNCCTPAKGAGNAYRTVLRRRDSPPIVLVGAKPCAIVDPKRDVEEHIAKAKRLGLTITHILETHLHADFVRTRRIGAAYRAKIYAPRSGGCTYDHVAVARATVLTSKIWQVKVLDTPVTPRRSLLCRYRPFARDEPAAVFTGDNLSWAMSGVLTCFRTGRRTGLPALRTCTSQAARRLSGLSPPTGPVHLRQGHGRDACQHDGYERRFNPALQFATEAEFKTALLMGCPRRSTILPGVPTSTAAARGLVAEMPSPRPIFPKELRITVNRAYRTDTRDYSAFGGAHVPGAYNIDAAHNFRPSPAGSCRPTNRSFWSPRANEQVSALATMLRRVGPDVAGHLDRGMGPWIVSGMPIDHIPTTSIFEVKRCRDEEETGNASRRAGFG